jgi:Glyoxalase-like domain
MQSGPRHWQLLAARTPHSVRLMEMVRQVVVFDAADLHAESAFWAGILGGHVFADDKWHSVIDADGEWRIGVQLAPNHVPPDWPHGSPQQVHLDLHVEDPGAAHEQAITLGARLLQPASDLNAAKGHQVYADPAGHPFCIGWGHPSRKALAEFVADHLRQMEPSEGA